MLRVLIYQVLFLICYLSIPVEKSIEVDKCVYTVHMNQTGKKIVKFLIVGCTAALIELLVFFGLQSQLGDSKIYFSQTTSFFCGFMISFLLNKFWVFRSKGSAKVQLKKYSLLAAINLLLSNALLWILFDVLSQDEIIAKLFVMGSVATWNFFIFQKVIFK